MEDHMGTHMERHMEAHMEDHMESHMGAHMEGIMDYKYRHQEWYKDKKIDIKSNSRSDLIEKVIRKKAQIDYQTIDEDMKLAEFCRLYLETYKKESVSASWYEDLNAIADKLVSGIGNKPVGKIKPMEAQAFLNSQNYLADSTIKKITDFTKQIFSELQKNGATKYQFDLIAPKGKSQMQGRSLTPAEQQALLKAIKGHRGEIFISLIYYCGLRPSEASALLWKDVDLNRNIITVNKSLKKNGTIGDTKTASSMREIPIPISLSTLLKKSRKSPFLPVCEQRNGYHTKSSIRKLWASVKKATEAELGRSFEARLYDLRHTYCTNLEKAGVPINIASRLMGHSDISITSKIYTHASDEAVEIARKCLEKASV